MDFTIKSVAVAVLLLVVQLKDADSYLSPSTLKAVEDYFPRAFLLGHQAAERQTRAEIAYLSLRARVGSGHSAFRRVQGFLGASRFSKLLGLPASQALESLRIIKERFHIKKDDLQNVLKGIKNPYRRTAQILKPDDTPPRPLLDTCPFAATYECNASAPYRTYDGSCNNLWAPHWGVTSTPLARVLPPDYANGIDSPRRAKDGSELPGARLLSVRVFPDAVKPAALFTNMLMSIGQVIDHDLDRTAVAKLTGDNNASTLVDVRCGADGCATGDGVLKDCFPIPIPRGDPEFSGKKCLKFVRTQEVPALSCALGPREQFNQINSYLDASFIYGNTKEDALKLRTKQQNGGEPGARIAMIPHPFAAGKAKPLLPLSEDDLCRDVNETIKCFTSGDGRVNENVALTSQHTLFSRYHNLLAGRLGLLNPTWAPERTYQEARRILGAVWQRIVYDEWLPVVLGPLIMKKFGLSVLRHGYSYDYDEKVSASVSNAFATSAFRFGHSLVPTTLWKSDRNYNIIDEIPLSSGLHRPFEVYNLANDGIDGIVRGLLSQNAETMDRFFTEQITSRLFSENPPGGLGTDLAALNIQRGRDHGIPGYNAWRVKCGLRKAHTFDDFAQEIPNYKYRHLLQQLYTHVDDVDSYVAAILEQKVPGGILGPTFACIIANQFRAAKRGDRFWFENGLNTQSKFTPAQLHELRKSSLARLICDTGDDIETIQPMAMLLPRRQAAWHLGPYSHDLYAFAQLYRGKTNDRVPCAHIPDIDLNLWAEGAPAEAPYPL